MNDFNNYKIPYDKDFALSQPYQILKNLLYKLGFSLIITQEKFFFFNFFSKFNDFFRKFYFHFANSNYLRYGNNELINETHAAFFVFTVNECHYSNWLTIG